MVPRAREISADLCRMVDRAAGPAELIRLILAEIEDTLVEVRAAAARAIADGKELSRAIERLDTLQRSWADKAELAASKGRDDLAAAALLERQRAGESAADLRRQAAAVDTTLRAYRADIARLQSRLEDMRSRQRSSGRSSRHA